MGAPSPKCTDVRVEPPSKKRRSIRGTPKWPWKKSRTSRSPHVMEVYPSPLQFPRSNKIQPWFGLMLGSGTGIKECAALSLKDLLKGVQAKNGRALVTSMCERPRSRSQIADSEWLRGNSGSMAWACFADARVHLCADRLLL